MERLFTTTYTFKTPLEKEFFERLIYTWLSCGLNRNSRLEVEYFRNAQGVYEVDIYGEDIRLEEVNQMDIHFLTRTTDNLFRYFEGADLWGKGGPHPLKSTEELLFTPIKEIV